MIIQRLLCVLVLLNVALDFVRAEDSDGESERSRPDVLLIMADDIGIEGLGCYGGASYRTPHLDAMAASGVRFTQAFAQPLCSNTRLQLMTGRYNHRNWGAFGILPPDETTFGHLAKSAGYQTAIFGKWQLQSYDPPDFPNADRRRSTGMHPKDAGFDHYALFHSLHTEDKGSRYAAPTMLEGKAGEAGELKHYPNQYGEDIWADRVIKFLKQPSEKPRFVYYPMALPHRPFEPPPTSSNYTGTPLTKETDDVKHIDEMIQYMDTIVGRIMDALRDADRLDETIVVFYSDNGTHQAVTSEMNDGRMIGGGKGLVTQTAIHVPLIVHAPWKFRAGTNDSIVDSTDFFPTLADWFGVKPGESPKQDGVSIASALETGERTDREAAFFWYDPRPGWDKEKFTRRVFAVNHDGKAFRDGQYFRFTDKPLEEVEVASSDRTPADQKNIAALQRVMDDRMKGSEEPPLVDAFGDPTDR